jgi:penicillin amidase
MGFNQDIAWGLTTGFIDTYDVFVERDAPFDKKQIPISIAGQTDQTFKISVSANGPVLESLTDALGITEPTAREYWTSLYWVMKDIPTSAGTLASLPLARTSKEFGEALFEEDICPLVNNLICVDQSNDLRRFIAATIPKRRGVTGTVPLPGWRTEYKFELSCAAELLVEHNPANGFALTANNDTMGDRGDYPIHNFPTFSSRADRIRELLEQQGSGFSSHHFEEMQLDQKDLKALDWVPGLLSCLTDPSKQVQRARQLLAEWDFDAGTDSRAACIFYPLMDKRWHIRFMREVLADDLILSQPVIAPALNRFGINDFMQPGSPWLQHRHILERIINETVKQLVTDLDREFGANWTWGQLQHVNFWHALHKHEPWKGMKAGPDPIGGSGTTLRMALHEPAADGTEKVRVYHGPAFRWVIDLADPLHFRFVIAGGNGGRPGSDSITDHYDRWLKGKYYDISLVREEIEIRDTLHLDPE